jgi:hypothetical protein
MSLVTIGLKAFPKPTPITTPKLEALLLKTPRVALDLSRAVSLLVTWTFLILYFQNCHNVTVTISDSGSVPIILLCALTLTYMNFVFAVSALFVS